jgi:hypothetical protein
VSTAGLDYDAPMTTPEEPPLKPKPRGEVAAADIERQRDRLLECLLAASPDPRTSTRKKKTLRRGRRRAHEL